MPYAPFRRRHLGEGLGLFHGAIITQDPPFFYPQTELGPPIFFPFPFSRSKQPPPI